MTNEQFFKLTEGFKDVDGVLTAWLSPEAINEANSIWEEKAKTRDGQLEILDAAHNGEASAVNYLYNRFLPLVRKVFWKYYAGPDKKLAQDSKDQSNVINFSAIAYNMLSGAESPSPYNTFNPDKFDEKADLINQFSYYYYRYLQSEAFKLIRKERKGAFSGNKDSEEDSSVISYDDFASNTTEAAADDFSDDANLNLIYDDFTKWLSENKAPIYKDIWELLRSGMKPEKISEELNLANAQQVRNYFNRIKKYFRALYPEIMKNH